MTNLITIMANISFWWLGFLGLFVLDLSSHSRIFHSYGDVIITSDGLQILTKVSTYGYVVVFFSMLHLLWHKNLLIYIFISVFSEDLTLTHVAEWLALELSLSVLMT